MRCTTANQTGQACAAQGWTVQGTRWAGWLAVAGEQGRHSDALRNATAGVAQGSCCWRAIFDCTWARLNGSQQIMACLLPMPAAGLCGCRSKCLAACAPRTAGPQHAPRGCLPSTVYRRRCCMEWTTQQMSGRRSTARCGRRCWTTFDTHQSRVSACTALLAFPRWSDHLAPEQINDLGCALKPPP